MGASEILSTYTPTPCLRHTGIYLEVKGKTIGLLEDKIGSHELKVGKDFFSSIQDALTIKKKII